jgi:tetratricopeptide (TPR) repeat protein
MEQDQNNPVPPPIPEMPVVLEAGNKKKLKLSTIVTLMFVGFFLFILIFDFIRFKSEERKLKGFLDQLKIELTKLEKVRNDAGKYKLELVETEYKIEKALILLPENLDADEFRSELKKWIKRSKLKITDIVYEEEKGGRYSVGIFNLYLKGKLNDPLEFIERKDEFERIVNISILDINDHDIEVGLKIFAVNKPLELKGPSSIIFKNQKPKKILLWSFTKKIKELEREIEETKIKLKEYSIEKEKHQILLAKKEYLNYMISLIDEIESGDAEINRILKESNQHLNRGIAYYNRLRYKEAILEFNMAIALSPTNVDANYWRAYAFMRTDDHELAVQDFTIYLTKYPTHIPALSDRAQSYIKTKNYKLALADMKRVQELSPGDPGVDNNLAWFYATCPDENYRDGDIAVSLALIACRNSKWKATFTIDTLGASYAEVGDFENAVKYQQMAVNKEKDPEVKKGMIERLELYKSGEPYREN